MDQILRDLGDKLNKTLDVYKSEISGIRTGRANTSLIEGVKVEAYGSSMNLRDVASINAPEPRLLTVQPWDASLVNSIVKAIQSASVGLNPAVDGALIRVPIPALTEERRRDFLKVVNQKSEEAKVSVRQIRRDAIEQLDKLEKSKDISGDDNRRLQERIQKSVDEFSSQIESLASSKSSEIMTV